MSDHPALLRMDTLSAFLLPLPSSLWMITVSVTPRSRFDTKGLGRAALSTLATTLAFLSVDPLVLLGAWVISTVLFLSALRAPQHRSAFRAATSYLSVSTLLFAAGVVLLALPNDVGGTREQAAIGLVTVAILIRKAILPFHAWLPHVFDRGRIGPAVLFSAPQLGSYAAIVLVVPRASPGMLEFVAILSLLTTVHGAILALAQRDVRRACGYLFISQSALVLAGASCANVDTIAASLLIWLASALSFTGIARCVLMLEARRGRLDLSQYHGGYEQMPSLATSFLVLGLSCTGFPGTLGFVGEELLVEGSVKNFPILGLFVVAMGAFTGLAVLRIYFSLFCGRRHSGVRLPLLTREVLAFAAVASVLLGLGLAPRPVLSMGVEVGRSLAESRPRAAPAVEKSGPIEQ